MQVPTVTLEDLQAFQAAHFPGHHQPLHAPTAEPVVEDELYADEDDLGYYPDGVKRTLTDEQIRIFRHSEIHALLRKRQLEQDEAEYEARARKLSDDTVNAEVETRREEPVPDEGNVVDEQNVHHAAHGQGQGHRSSGGAKSKKRGHRETRNEPEQTLDYEDVDQSPAPRARPTDPRAPYPGRRIISYED
ncbi:uncharacterized protein N7496_012216 [Penicillium cataractarum]|uniref:Uncharacterized protein n=1 Tax=Penicillium cataractarum TaxID=2100454 RepID=A0A9W9R963_9EURO|nr:uncharacterized protein N7496_012216 [Penicillium cataractarum]KAJ5355004.1 hypothetical protein N7496_012216 [Penicillium cataractarum]